MTKSTSIEATRSTICALRLQVTRGDIRCASHEWGGADVVIATRALGTEYREVVTPFASQLSWLFFELRDAFAELINGFTKFEFYGRLATVAKRAIANDARISCADLCIVVLDAAEEMLSEMTCDCTAVGEPS